MGVLGMDLASTLDCQARFSAYVEGVASVIGHADREGPLRDYCMGLLLPGERKSVEPMAAITAPARTAAQHQSLLHFVGESGWDENGGKVHWGVRWLLSVQISHTFPQGGGICELGATHI